MSYQRVDAYLDPLGLVKLPDGTIAHELELAFTDAIPSDPHRVIGPAWCQINAARAREFAFELLVLADQAEHARTSTRREEL